MKNRLKICLILFLSTNNIAFTQKSNSFQFFSSPYIQKIGNLNNQYTQASNENIEVDYLKVPSKEFGFEFLHKFQSRWGYSVGLSWANSGTKSIITQTHSEYPYIVLNNHYKTLQYSSFGLRIGASYHLVDRINLRAFLNLYLPYSEKTNTYYLTSFEVGSGQLFNYNTKIIVGGTVGSIPDIIPDFRADFEIYPNINFYTGMRLKFWDFFDDYTMKVEVTGYAGHENYGKDEILHLSKAKGTDVSYYFGLLYNLPIKKKDQVE